MLPPTVENPFSLNKADDTLSLPAGDVPELHAEVLQACREAVRRADQTGRGQGVMVVGEAGSGKSHLLARLRLQLAATPRAVFAVIRLNNAFAGRLWRPLRTRLVEEWMRPYANPAHGGNGLLRLLRNTFPAWAASAQTASGSLLDWQLGRLPQADLTPHLEEFDRATPLDYDLLRVLPQLGHRDTTGLALAWLRGRQLRPEDLQRLGLAGTIGDDQSQEASAQEVVLSLLRLAGKMTIPVVAFDEIEAIQAGTWDAAVLRQFATMATTLLSEASPRVVITSIRDQLAIDVRKAVELSNIQKFAQVQATVPKLTRPQCDQVVHARLATEPSLREGRKLRPAEPDWPLAAGFVETTFRENRGLTPRHLIMASYAEFERVKKGLPALPPGGPGSGPLKPRPLSFTRAWEARRDRNLAVLSGVNFDHVMGTALPWLVGLTDRPLLPSNEVPSTLGDVSLMFESRRPGEKPVAISFCNQPPPTLRHRLPRLLKQWQAAKGRYVRELVLLRCEAERTTEYAAGLIKELSNAGARPLVVTRQQLAELAAFHGLLMSAQTGELVSPDGKPAPREVYDRWVTLNLSGSVKELLDSIFGPEKVGETAAAGARAAAGAG